MKQPLTDELKGEIDIMRETALRLRDEMKSPSLKAKLDRALMDLDAIPQLFDSEEHMRQALIYPFEQIREVVAIRGTHGPDVQLVPEQEN